MVEISELDLVEKFRKAKQKKTDAESVLEEATKEFESVEAELIEMLEAKGATSTAKYQGVGFVSLTKPRVFASCLKENQDALFGFLTERGRVDLIKQVVMPQSLSGFVKEMLEQGEGVPEIISYYLKPGARFYEA